MEVLFDYFKTSHFVTLYKDVCELTEEEILGNHKSDMSDVEQIFYFNRNMFRHEYDVIKKTYDVQLFNENKKNIFAGLTFDKIRVIITKTDNKVSFKYFTYTLGKCVGVKYFTKNTRCQYLTYDFKTDSLYSGVINNYHKKRANKTFAKNRWDLKHMKIFSNVISSALKSFKSRDFDELYKSQLEINKAFDIFLSNIPGLDNTIQNPDDKLYKKYLDGKGIKVPNNWMCFERKFPQIKLKDFRKHKNKFVDTYMAFYELSGDKVKRVLHIVNSTTGINMFKFALKLFGNDFILSQSDETIKDIIESNSNNNLDGWGIHIHIKHLTKKEIKNCFEIFKLVLINEINFSTFIDHVITKNKLHLLEPVNWKSNTYDKFTEEHFEWSEKISSFQKVKYNRFYDEDFKNIIEKPFEDYHPVLLTDNKQYNIESFVQSNCVRTYADRPESIIISIRKNDKNNKERASVEYKITEVKNSIKLNRVQSLGRHNKMLDESWNGVLEILDNRVEHCLINDIFKLPTFEITYGDRSITSNVYFSDNFEYANQPGQRGGIRSINKHLYFSNDEVYSLTSSKFVPMPINDYNIHDEAPF